ncbi:MAG: hypothetical protein DLM58_16585 [Pseudonocardiales bacterium]|nr:MAG: hypothetical protein DLM58_16585 [Pseudonocardiales bacterium]
MAAAPGARRFGFGLPGLVITVAGTGLLLGSFLFLDWFEGTDLAASPRRDGIQTTTSLTLREAYIASTQSRLGVLVHSYVAWLGWGLVLVVVLAAIASGLPGPRSKGWRMAGVVVGAGGVAATYFACHLSFASDPDSRLRVWATSGFTDTKLGPKVAVAGFLLCAFGAALGPLGARPAPSGEAARPEVGGAALSRGVASLAALAVGTTLLVIAFKISWYHTDRYDADPQISFGDLINAAGGRPVPRISAAFIPTLAWVLVVAAVCVVAFANLRTALTPLFRAAGVLIGLSGVVLTYVALARLFTVTYNPAATNGQRSVFFSTSPGLWFGLTGYLLFAVAAAIAAPARRPASTTIPAPEEPTAVAAGV